MKKVLYILLIVGIILTSTFTALTGFTATMGDVNDDGRINSSDALGILQYSVGSNPKEFITDVADITGDGRINSSDALFVLQVSVGSIKLPTGSPHPGVNNGGNGGNGGSSNSTTFTTPTTGTTKSVKDQLAEIKDRWDDVIKPSIDADGNITVESTNGQDTGLFGFKYSTKDKCFIASEDASQRNFGYDEGSDESAPAIAITYDTIRVKFDYDGMEWMVQYWKGQYGMVMVGAEIGVYNRPAGTAGTHYECANDETKLLQSMTVYRRVDGKYNQLFARSPSRTWWCTGFIPGTLGAAQYNVPVEATRELRVDSKITMASPEMAQAFVAGLKEVGSLYHNTPETMAEISFAEMSSIEEYEASAEDCKFVLEEDGVTVRVCWR
jgi:hypothetical protein